jgi:predicted ArsR family transcriptional regulator
MSSTSAIERYPPTQQRLLRALLRAPDGMSVERLTKALGITHNAVRTHLATLQRDGVINRLGQRPTGGRPEFIFVLSPAGRESFPRRYRQIAENLISEVGNSLGHAALEKVMRRMGKKAGTQLTKGRTTVSVTDTAAAMKQLGYEASVSRSGHADNEIVARNCVFHQLAEHYPAVCQFDLAFMETAVGRRVEHRECMVRGGRVCRFGFKG